MNERWTETEATVFAEDHTYRPGELAEMRRFKWVSPGFLKTMGTPLVAARIQREIANCGRMLWE